MGNIDVEETIKRVENMSLDEFENECIKAGHRPQRKEENEIYLDYEFHFKLSKKTLEKEGSILPKVLKALINEDREIEDLLDNTDPSEIGVFKYSLYPVFWKSIRERKILTPEESSFTEDTYYFVGKNIPIISLKTLLSFLLFKINKNPTISNGWVDINDERLDINTFHQTYNGKMSLLDREPVPKFKLKPPLTEKEMANLLSKKLYKSKCRKRLRKMGKRRNR